MGRKKWLAAAAALLACGTLLLTGCGGGDKKAADGKKGVSGNVIYFHVSGYRQFHV